MVSLDISHTRHRAPRQEAPAPQPGARRPIPARKAAGRRPSGPVVPQSVKGRFRRIKWTTLALCLAIYGLLPFLRWTRGPGEPDQAVLFDFVKGRLYFFFVEIWPQELYYVTGLLVLASVFLIFLNAVAGRVWCGFLCPQTVWTDLFLAVERLVEGDRRDRLRKREAGLTPRRVAELGVKHAIWLAIAIWTGAGLVLYFGDAPQTLREFATGEASLLAYSWVGIIAALTYTLAGFAREQVCTWMCPWPRLQGAIWDPEALTVNYRDYRGEPRGSAKKAAELRAAGEPAGDCVDCLQCVNVCPIGIDIREGPNFACINCGLCVDACDSVMTKLGRPTGLIAYESWRNIERGRSREPQARRVIRPKTVGLAAALVVLSGGMGAVLASRTMGGLTVLHDRNPVAVRLSGGAVRNGYMLRILNKEGRLRSFAVRIAGIAEAKAAVVGPEPVVVDGDSTAEVRVTVTAPAGSEGALRFSVVDRETGAAYAADDVFLPAP
ncbi:cytochrome c oxidase accessory protein CcoG [Alsobacter soli]|uniref:Cytochrome c oxidase accessory protein CcoG n=1 Tax=Alsobacter soli TaxID=2109933 RepID=A0A2T1HQ44_9HYPH|nr:cytochrome c oxidase accessory protein CcoG [Alsobacter soli]PSC03781.1 cytochrome c oxidase accessory protein CcoG [Alsobacter soli]